MQAELIQLIAGRQGHFQMESGYHSEWWFKLDPLFDDLPGLQPFVAELARRLAPHGAEVICGPMTGGAILARLVAAELGVPGFFTERFEDPAATGLFPVSYSVPASQREELRGKKVAIVDDAISAGSAARGTYTDLLACGARPVALGALFIFGEAAAPFAARHQLALEGIARVSLGLWKPGDCPLCQAGRPLEKVSDARDEPGPTQQPTRGLS